MAKKESKKTQKRRRRAKIEFGLFGLLFFVIAIFALELSLILHPSKSRGVIQSIDLTAHTLLLTSTRQNEPIAVSWTDSTEFFVEGVKSDPERLQPDMKATVSTREPLVFPNKVLKITAYVKKQVATDGK